MTHNMKMLNHERDGLIYKAKVNYRGQIYDRKEVVEKFEKVVVNRTITWKCEGEGVALQKELESIFKNKDLIQY